MADGENVGVSARALPPGNDSAFPNLPLLILCFRDRGNFSGGWEVRQSNLQNSESPNLMELLFLHATLCGKATKPFFRACVSVDSFSWDLVWQVCSPFQIPPHH